VREVEANEGRVVGADEGPRPVFPGLLRALRARRSIHNPLFTQGIGDGGVARLRRGCGEVAKPFSALGGAYCEACCEACE
jgi:hypothetical protein